MLAGDAQFQDLITSYSLSLGIELAKVMRRALITDHGGSIVDTSNTALSVIISLLRMYREGDGNDDDFVD